MSDPHARRLARRIVRRLMTTGQGRRATRLVLEQTDSAGKGHDLGGWCEKAAVDQVEGCLLRLAMVRRR